MMIVMMMMMTTVISYPKIVVQLGTKLNIILRFNTTTHNYFLPVHGITLPEPATALAYLVIVSILNSMRNDNIDTSMLTF